MPIAPAGSPFRTASTSASPGLGQRRLETPADPKAGNTIAPCSACAASTAASDARQRLRTVTIEQHRLDAPLDIALAQRRTRRLHRLLGTRAPAARVRRTRPGCAPRCDASAT
jgi:hypothetical protein